MEPQSNPTTEQPAYGEAFRTNVSKALDELNKLSFVPPHIKDKIATEAGKLCLAEALIEHKAYEAAANAEETWRTKLRPDAERLVGKAAEAAKTGLGSVETFLSKFAKAPKA